MKVHFASLRRLEMSKVGRGSPHDVVHLLLPFET